MKNCLFFLTCLLAWIAPATAHNDPSHVSYKEIKAEELKSWIDNEKKLVLIDARSAAYDDGERIPGAKQLPPDSTTDEIKAVIPTLDTVVVIYCSSPDCPASKWLAARLVELGYTSVYKYPEGIYGWKERGYPTVPATK